MLLPPWSASPGRRALCEEGAHEGDREGSEAELVRACFVAGPRVMGGRGERGIRGWSASPVLGRSVAAAGDGWPSAGGFASVFSVSSFASSSTASVSAVSASASASSSSASVSA
ncbi:uncharacterized protein DS421_8g234360 [Arachis hypogaea]|nr:uncharacterized protein LOC114924313 [Arachis hypogaea]QHO30564.1 uncharacterized protein DS421_8g234360 [Arachis hypogaea]